MQSIQTNAQITGIRAKVDGSIVISVNTPELSSSEKVAFMNLQNLNVKMTIEPTDDKPTDTLKVSKGIDGKSPSQRLYNVIFVYYKQVKSVEDFDVFYRRQIEGIIDQFKARLKD